jgi:hypothetical protein
LTKIRDADGYGKRFIVRADEMVTPFRIATGDKRVRGEFDLLTARIRNVHIDDS